MNKEIKLYTYVDGINDTPFPNEEEQIVTTFEYNVSRMGDVPTIKATIKHRLCLDDLWTDNVYAEFNGEKYYVLSTPSSNKDNRDDRYVHELELKSEREALNNVYFIDAVQGDESIDQTKSNTSKVMFMGDINEFAARFNASFAYSNLPYKVVVNEGITSEVKLVSFEKLYLMSALQEIYNIFNIPYYFDGATIHVGYTDDAIPNVFRYGSQDALLSISKNNANYRIVNRCTGKGSSDNIPYYYPNKTAKGDLIAKAADTNVTLKQANIQITDAVKFSERFNINDKISWNWVNGSNCMSFTDAQMYRWINGVEKWYSYKEYAFESFLYKKFDWNREMTVRLIYDVKKKCKLSFDVRTDVYSGTNDVVAATYTNLPRNGEYEVGRYQADVTINFMRMPKFGETIETVGFRFNVSLGVSSQQVKGWSLNGGNSSIDLKIYGLALSNITEEQLTLDDSISQELGTLIPSTSVLMPPIYRNSLGKESFYNALNNTYKKPNSEEYYVFENEYTDNNRKEIDVDFSDIKPTIFGMTNAAGQRMDKFIEFAWDENDNDEFDYETNEYQHQYFFAKLPKYDGENGFNLFAHASEQGNMQISMTSGHCGACTFEIGVGEETQKNTVQVDETTNELLRDENGNVRCGREGMPKETPQDWQQDTTQREIWIALKKDTSTYGTVLPSKKRNVIPSTDDTFVILNINLPDAYIFNAEKKLEESIIKYMSENNVEKFTFDIKFSRIYFTEHPEVLDMLNENSRIIIEYNGQQQTLYVDSYSYKMDDSSPLPEIGVSLTDTLSVGQNSLENAITQVTTDILKSPNGDFIAQGTKYFLRKDVEDAAQKTITFEQGLRSNNIESRNFTSGALGSGHKLFTDPNTGQSYCEIDRLYVRMKAYFDTLEIKEVSHIGGELILTPASMKCNRVEVIEPKPSFYVDGTQKVYKDGELAYTARKYRCYFNADDGDEAIQNQFVVGDLAYCKQFNIESGIYTNVSNRFYWYEVTGVGSNYIEITEGQCAEGSDIPKEGDTIVSLGNKTDAFRQNAIILSTVGINAPSKILYQGINDYSLAGKAIIEEGFDPESNQAYKKTYGKTYIGARDESSYISFDPTTNKMKIKAEVEITSGSGFGNLTDAPDMDAINQSIQNAQDAADAANADLTNFKLDSIISPVEKTALKQQLADINSEYSQIIADANKYSVSTTTYTTAYNSAKAALTKYTATTPEFITVGTDYNNISDYYTARQTILNTIAQKAKDYADSVGADAAQNAKDDLAVKMGYNSYDELVAAAEAETTIIKGGHINTSLIEAKAITADMINADGITAVNVDLTGKITATSGSFEGEVTATSGSFTGTVNANDGLLGSMTIKDGSYEYGIFYNGDNTTLSMRPGMFMNIPYNVFTPEEGTPQSNVLLYLKRRRDNVYDRSIYIEGISEFYGRVGIGKANNTGMNQFLPALVVEGIGCYGQFCLDNKIINSSTVLDNTYAIAFVAMSSSGSYIRLPSSNLTNGQILIIRKVDGSNFKIYGKIKNTSNKIVEEITIDDASLNIFIYNATYKYWTLNFIN